MRSKSDDQWSSDFFVNLQTALNKAFSASTQFSSFDNLSKYFIVTCDSGLELLTVRHYKNEEIEQLLLGKDLLLTQKNKSTIQLLYKL